MLLLKQEGTGSFIAIFSLFLYLISTISDMGHPLSLLLQNLVYLAFWPSYFLVCVHACMCVCESVSVVERNFYQRVEFFIRSTDYAGEDNNRLSSDESSDKNSDESNKEANIVKWIFDNTKSKVVDIFEKITKLVNDLFKLPPDNGTKTAGTPDPFEERLRTSFLLSVVVLLIVVVTRAHPDPA